MRNPNHDATGHDRRSSTLEMEQQDPDCTPTPRQVHSEDAVGRAFQCTSYRYCLDIAANMKWQGWDCMACPAVINKQEVPEV